jgi:hypothetical protein
MALAINGRLDPHNGPITSITSSCSWRGTAGCGVWSTEKPLGASFSKYSPNNAIPAAENT